MILLAVQILLSRIVTKFAKKQLKLACLFSIVSEIRFVFNKIQKNNYFFVFSCDNLKNKSLFLSKLSENEMSDTEMSEDDIPVYACFKMGRIRKTVCSQYGNDRDAAIYEVIAILIEFHYNVGIGGSYDEDE